MQTSFAGDRRSEIRDQKPEPELGDPRLDLVDVEGLQLAAGTAGEDRPRGRPQLAGEFARPEGLPWGPPRT
jgi:hypothetical protein